MRDRLATYLPGACVAAFGLGVAGIAAGYPAGSLLRPGPGFFPVVIGLLMVALGAGIAVEARQAPAAASSDEDTVARFPWRPVLCTSVGILAFALLLDRTGLVPATVALVLFAAFGEPRRDWLAVIAVCLFMAAFGTILFIWGLGLPVEPFGAS